MASEEYHVASYVVRTKPEDAATLAGRIRETAGMEVHAEERGTLVVTAEAHNVRDLADLTETLLTMESVLSVAPVYHEYSGDDSGAATVQ